jgi:hypothetical protein
MKIGTKSLLFGAHCILIHPVFVAIAWIKLFGWPWDPRYWVAFFVHDLGYWGKPNMDGEEGETHPEYGALLMHKWFDKKGRIVDIGRGQTMLTASATDWHDFTVFHSKTYAKKHGKDPSMLYAADKLAMSLEPRWLYLLKVRLTGEISEYMEICSEEFQSQKEWYKWTSHLLREKAYLFKNSLGRAL